MLDDHTDTELVRYVGEEWGLFGADGDGVGSVNLTVVLVGSGGLGSTGASSDRLRSPSADALIYRRDQRVIKFERIAES